MRSEAQAPPDAVRAAPTFAAPTLSVATRPGVLAPLRAPGARQAPAAPDAGAQMAAPRRSVGRIPSHVGVAASVALVRIRPFLQLATGLRETRRSCAARPRCTH